jgi:hypothetical protein
MSKRTKLNELSYITLSVLLVIAIVLGAMFLIYPILTASTEAAIKAGVSIGEQL